MSTVCLCPHEPMSPHALSTHKHVVHARLVLVMMISRLPTSPSISFLGTNPNWILVQHVSQTGERELTELLI